MRDMTADDDIVVKHRTEHNRQRVWSAASDAYITRMWPSAMTNGEIACELGVGKATLNTRARLLGLGPRIKTVWDDDRDAELTKMWNAGLSAREIANNIGNDFTKNAVIGRAHRLGLKKRHTLQGARSTSKPRTCKPRTSKPSKPASVGKSKPPSLALSITLAIGNPDTVEPSTGRKGVLEIGADECRWPMPGDGKTMCSHQKREGSSYCDHHHSMAYCKPQPLTSRMVVKRSLLTGISGFTSI